MSPAEKQLAATIHSYLATRGDRIASDLGLLVFHEVGDLLIAVVGGDAFAVTIVVTKVTKSANDNTKPR